MHVYVGACVANTIEVKNNDVGEREVERERNETF